MNRANLWRASLVMMVALAACGEELPVEQQASSLATRQDEVFSSNKALILGSTVAGGTNSPEAAAVRKLGYAVQVVTEAEWSAMTAEQFATYRVLILGDKGCSPLNAVSAAVANRAVWGPVVNGNVLIAGTAPTANGANLVTERAVRFAAFSAGKTGLYASLSCYYQNAEPNTHVELLEPFGDFKVQDGNCHSEAHIVSSHSALNVLTDATMSNWPCSVSTSFTQFPMANFAPWAVAAYPVPEAGAEAGSMGPGVQQYVDGSIGAPYILARGATLNHCGDGWAMLIEQCDLGVEVNGMPGSACSLTCQLNWCGDGKVSAGEDCDPSAPGMASCPRSCRLVMAPPPPPPPTNLPPVAVCKNLTLNTPNNACGASGSVDNGSYDPEGGAVSCTQSKTSFNRGPQSVTLTCTDAQGLTASCNAHVTVVDVQAPEIACPAASSFECGVGSASPEQNPATATDNCGAPFISYTLEGESFSVGAARGVRWSAHDGTNEATCTSEVTMVDTLAPSISLNGPARQRLECKVDGYTEQSASAYDLCAGDLSERVAITGAVNTAAVGLYPVSYRISDAAGHEAVTGREVEVADTLAPVLALNGEASMALECGVDSYTEPNAKASDLCAGPLPVAIS
ncbi:MAG TPA: immunoglobulin-like domain-containing protein, partial [Myxococcaceae bacterium]